MAVTAEELARAGIALSPADFDRLVRRVVQEVGQTRPASLASPALPLAEAAALARVGLVDAPLPLGAPDPSAVLAARFAVLLAGSLSVAEAAARLGVHPARVRQRLAERTLYGFKQGYEWRLPAFQFTEVGAVPGIELVLPHLDPEEHPVEVERWFTLPSAELMLADEPVSPRAWLLAGRPARVVAEAAALLDS